MTDSAKSSRFRIWQAVTVGLLVTGYAGYYFCRSNFNATLPKIIDEVAGHGVDRDVAKASLGQIVTLGTLAYAIGKIIGGGLSARLGGRGLFLIGMLGSSLCTLGFAAGGSLVPFSAAWIGNRFMQSLGWLGLVQMTARWVSHARYGTVMGLLSVSYLWGDYAVRSLIGQMLRDGLTWRIIFVVAAASLGALFLVNVLLLRETPRSLGFAEPEADPLNVYGGEAADQESSGLRQVLSPLIRNRTFLLACGLSMGFTLLRETFNTWTTEYYVKGVGLSPAEASIRSAQFPLWGGFSVLIAGALSDRLGRSGRAAILFGGLLLTGAALLGLGTINFEGSKTTPVALVTAIGFLMVGPYSYLAGAVAMDLGGKRGSAPASGLIDAVGYVGALLSGFGIARLSTRYTWAGAFLVLAGVAALTSVAALLFWMAQLKPRPDSGNSPSPPHTPR